jgi:hypothetical protein
MGVKTSTRSSILTKCHKDHTLCGNNCHLASQCRSFSLKNSNKDSFLTWNVVAITFARGSAPVLGIWWRRCWGFASDQAVSRLFGLKYQQKFLKKFQNYSKYSLRFFLTKPCFDE